MKRTYRNFEMVNVLLLCSIPHTFFFLCFSVRFMSNFLFLFLMLLPTVNSLPMKLLIQQIAIFCVTIERFTIESPPQINKGNTYPSTVVGNSKYKISRDKIDFWRFPSIFNFVAHTLVFRAIFQPITN